MRKPPRIRDSYSRSTGLLLRSCFAETAKDKAKYSMFEARRKHVTHKCHDEHQQGHSLARINTNDRYTGKSEKALHCVAFCGIAAQAPCDGAIAIPANGNENAGRSASLRACERKQQARRPARARERAPRRRPRAVRPKPAKAGTTSAWFATMQFSRPNVYLLTALATRRYNAVTPASCAEVPQQSYP